MVAVDKAEGSYRDRTKEEWVTLVELPLTRKLLAQGRISRQDVEFMLDTPADKYLLHAGPIQLAEYVE